MSAEQAVSSRLTMLTSSTQRQFRFSESPTGGGTPSPGGGPASCYPGNNRLLVKTIHNLKLICNSSDLQFTPPLALTGVWEPDTTALLFRYLRPGMRFLEVGANIGYFTVLAGNIVTHTGRVDAFEPNPEAFQLLEQNAKMNYISHHSRLYPFALAESSGRRMLHTSDVECRTLDEVYQNDTVVFDMVKVDAEGSEPLVFQGGQQSFLRKNVHDGTVFVLQFCPRTISGLGLNPTGFLDYLRGEGFRICRRTPSQDLDELPMNHHLDLWTRSELLISRSPFRLR